MSAVSCKEIARAGRPSELVKAIPANATFIVKINDIAKFNASLDERSYGQTARNRLLIPSLIENHTALTVFLKGSTLESDAATIPMLASVHLASAESMNSIHYYPLSCSKKTFTKLLSEHFPGAASQEWNYEGVTFNEILITDLNTKLTLAYTEGILIASTVSFLVEDAVKQLKGGNTLLSDPGFKDVYKKETSGADANIWFPFENARHWVSMFASYNSLDDLEVIGDFASWMLLDVYLNEEEIFLSGITSAKNNTRLAQLKSVATCSHLLQDHLPFNTAAHFHFSSHVDSTAAELKALGMGSCWSKVLLEPLNAEIKEHWVILLPIEEAGLFDQKKENRQAVSTLFGKYLFNGRKAYFEKSGELVAISPNRQTLDNYLNNIHNGQVLANDEQFNKLAAQLRTNAQSSLYFRTMYLKEAFMSIYESKEAGAKDFNDLKGFNQLAFQFSNQGSIFQTNAYITYSEEDGTSHTNLAWTVELDAPVLAGPEVVLIDKSGDHGVLVQDTDFNLYLIDRAGQTIWKKELESKWLGSAHSMQLFEDKSVQITFNTETNWHLLDAAGEEFAGFPLHFKDRAVAGMAFHSGAEGTNVFIPLNNDNLYGYEISGKPLPGWNPQGKMGALAFTPKVLESKGYIYIAATNKEGTAFIWDLKGKRKAKNMFRENFPSDHYIDTKASPFKIKNVRANGELISMSASGKVGKYRLQSNKISQFKMADVSGNSDPEIILSDGKTIWLYDYFGSLIWKKNHAGIIDVSDLGIGDRSSITVHNINENSLIVLDSKGNTFMAPPFTVGDHLSLSNKGLLDADQPALVTGGSENEVNCYRLAIPSE